MSPRLRAAHLLRLSAAFQVAREQDLTELAAAAVFVSYAQGQPVFRQGEPASCLYVVVSGLLRVSRLLPSGRELTLYLSGPRQLVAGVSAFVPEARFSAGCLAQQGGEVLVLPADTVRQLTYHSPALAQAVLTYVARRHAELLEQMEMLLFSDLNARLAGWLLGQAPGSAAILLPTNSELAAQLNTVPELVSRKLGEFYRLGHIGLQRREVRILNAAALRLLAAAGGVPSSTAP
jgi:CRP/FNR family transcriptional regulator, dissimilatory nitrate respiration regulator